MISMMVIVVRALDKWLLKGYLMEGKWSLGSPFLKSKIFVAGCAFLTNDINDKRIE